MARRTRTYVAFDADTDIRMYRLMQAWKANDGIDFDFNNAHDLTTIRPDSGEEAIKRSLHERMKNSKIFVLLVGENTKRLRKYVPWEIEIALKASLPMIVVNLNSERRMDSDLCPTLLQTELSIHIPYGIDIIQHALDNWPTSHRNHVLQGDSGPYFYKDATYTNLGL
jgi:hypothetical protein